MHKHMFYKTDFVSQLASREGEVAFINPGANGSNGAIYNPTTINDVPCTIYDSKA